MTRLGPMNQSAMKIFQHWCGLALILLAVPLWSAQSLTVSVAPDADGPIHFAQEEILHAAQALVNRQSGRGTANGVILRFCMLGEHRGHDFLCPGILCEVPLGCTPTRHRVLDVASVTGESPMQ
jgi:hypothetical protein